MSFNSPSSDASHVCGPSFYSRSSNPSLVYTPPYFYSPSCDEFEFSAKESMLLNGNRPSYAMVASGFRRGGLLPKRYRQGSSSSNKTCGTPRQGDKTYVDIFYPSDMFHLLLIRVSLHSLLRNKEIIMSSSSLDNNHPYDLKKHYTSMSCLHPSQLTKDFIDLLPAGSPHLWSMCAVCTTSSSVVGGLGPCIFLFNSRSNSKEVFRYNLHQPDMRFHTCANMAAAAVENALYVQIGDFFYVLSYAGDNLPVVQKYDIEKDIWTLVKDNITTRCSFTHNPSMISVPHVVINGKLHISFGYDSFAFDTEMDTWECSNLFDTFWKQNPFGFNGQVPWSMIETDNSKFVNRPFGFGFYGRGIVWDEDILLAVVCSSECQLVAFQLIDNKVVNSQPFTFTDHELNGPRLVDLGQGYFGLLHVTMSCFTTKPDWCCYELELVTILVSKPKQPRDYCFLECRIVRKDIVAENLNYGGMNEYKAFSV